MEGIRTRISSDVDGVVCVTGVGACVGALRLALVVVDQQLHPVAELLGGDGVPPAVAEAFALRRVRRRNPPSSVVHVEEQLEEQRMLCV